MLALALTPWHARPRRRVLSPCARAPAGLGADAPDELRYSSWRIQSVSDAHDTHNLYLTSPCASQARQRRLRECGAGLHERARASPHAYRRALAAARCARAELRARYALFGGAHLPHVGTAPGGATSSTAGAGVSNMWATAEEIAAARNSPRQVRETPTAMAYDDTGVLLAVGTRDGRLAVYNHTTLVGHAAAALAARNELAAASSLAAAADADASRSLRPEGIAAAGVGGSAGGDREAMAAHKRLAYAPPAPLVELSSRGGEWSALRWNPRNENEVVLSARTSGRVCVYDLAYCKTTPTQMLVAPSASAAGNAGGAGGSGAASSARAFEDVACLAPGGAYDVAAATRDGTVLLWDRRAGPRPVTTLLGPGGRANRLGPLRALGCVRLDGATGGTIVYAGTRGGRVLTWDVRKSGGSQVSSMQQPRGKSLLSAATTVGGGPRRGGRVGSGLGGGVHALLSVWEASDNSAVCALPVPAASGAHVHAAELPYVLTNGEVGILVRTHTC